jgi:uncharacterized protein
MDSQGAGIDINIGIGLKRQHAAELIQGVSEINFLEIHAENYMVDGGALHDELTRLRNTYELTIHGVGLSLGSEMPPDVDHLKRLKALINRYEPRIFSEHLAWTTNNGLFLNDLLPVAYTPRSLNRFINHLDMAQSFLGRKILLENPATYLRFDESSIPETAFITELIQRSGCGLLLDLNNVHVTCTNHRLNTTQYISELPLSAVQEIHLAGFSIDTASPEELVLLDDHGSNISEAVWELFQSTVAKIGAVPTLIERDNNIPPLSEMISEVIKASNFVELHTPTMTES